MLASLSLLGTTEPHVTEGTTAPTGSSVTVKQSSSAFNRRRGRLLVVNVVLCHFSLPTEEASKDDVESRVEDAEGEGMGVCCLQPTTLGC